MQLNEEQLHVLRHALTGGTDRVYRNHFCAGLDKMIVMWGLVGMGLMEPGVELSYGQTFHVTDAGAQAVGLQLPI